MEISAEFDVVGIGLNATDTLVLVPRFPAYAGKVRYEQELVSPGGEVATALAACCALGLRTKYMSIRKIAKETGVSPMTVQRIVKAGVREATNGFSFGQQATRKSLRWGCGA